MKSLGFPWIPLVESGFFNGLQGIQIKPSFLSLAARRPARPDFSKTNYPGSAPHRLDREPPFPTYRAGVISIPLSGRTIQQFPINSNKMPVVDASDELIEDEPSTPPGVVLCCEDRGQLSATGRKIAQSRRFAAPSQRVSEVQTRFSIVCASERARSSPMWPMTRWLRPSRAHQASDKSPRRSERVGASAAPFAKMQRRTGAPVGST
jgi:hypothetical protein